MSGSKIEKLLSILPHSHEWCEMTLPEQINLIRRADMELAELKGDNEALRADNYYRYTSGEIGVAWPFIQDGKQDLRGWHELMTKLKVMRQKEGTQE